MKKLVVLVGPTAVGKTELSLSLAESFTCPIISVDSRQLYRGLELGTAAPTAEEQSRVSHHFVSVLDIDSYYSASDFERDALCTLEQLYIQKDVVIASGGSMMYVDALCNGVDPMPTIKPEIRQQLYKQYETEGLDNILAQLKLLDPVHYKKVDTKNYKRVIHALEVCVQTGKPYSSFLSNSAKDRPFQIIKIGLERDREELYDRISRRVDDMFDLGLLREARMYHSVREFNALNTVGYKEIFAYLDGVWDLATTIEKIKRNTRIYAKQQLRWFKKDVNTHWINLSQIDQIEALKQIKGVVNLGY